MQIHINKCRECGSQHDVVENPVEHYPEAGADLCPACAGDHPAIAVRFGRDRIIDAAYQVAMRAWGHDPDGTETMAMILANTIAARLYPQPRHPANPAIPDPDREHDAVATRAGLDRAMDLARRIAHDVDGRDGDFSTMDEYAAYVGQRLAAYTD